MSLVSILKNADQLSVMAAKCAVSTIEHDDIAYPSAIPLLSRVLRALPPFGLALPISLS